ncbi:CmcJ/NvfI family oxidoreductase [Roseibium polysiphoniae]|uniref:Methyltransferase n=1 Tax=Roseibium polysiphoniae TaxID=2571221 RepID=A0ABR9CFT3_9HYPH|nr:CmcJ/NvfI family oxidoreductase [Roseibium polysiphoniae]MBD8878726.1 hypothetical protein [Roseibium polysiphoniae]
MSRTGIVNYHVHKPERQAFQIDAGGVAGKMVAPELVATEVPLQDLRLEETTVSFDQDGVGFMRYPTNVTSFSGGKEWAQVYDRELKDLLDREIGAKEAVVFDHTIRVDDPGSDRKPARNVHSDYSPEGAEQRLADILGDEKAAEWSRGHYAFINVWRPLENPINSAPLGFVRPSSVSERDWILLDLIYPNRRGQIMGLAANDHHEWIYSSRMRPDEVVYFNIFDNRGRPSVGHSAIDVTEDPDTKTIRKSLESRTLVRF